VSEQPGGIQEYAAVRVRTGNFTRAFDIFCAVTGLLLLSPALLVIAAAIRLDDRGPVFYRQVRVGRDFHPFRVWKFRSMITNADQHGLLTAPGDSRLTRVGRILRQYKLDELPQLFNVLKGEMQLVGARPEVERYVRVFPSQYAVILQERPGITDPATIAYRREEQIFLPGKMDEQYVTQILPDKLKLSLAYQEQRTPLSDVRILLRTVFGVIS